MIPVLDLLDFLDFLDLRDFPDLHDLLVLLLSVLEFPEQLEDVVVFGVVCEAETNQILPARLHLQAHPSVGLDEPDLCAWKMSKNI